MIANIANLKARYGIKKRYQKHEEQDLSESLPIDSDSSDKSDYKHKRRNKKKIYHKRVLIITNHYAIIAMIA